VCARSPNGGAKTATVPRLLTKRTYFPVLLIALAFPAAALAAGADGDRPRASVADAQVAQLAPLHRPVVRFHRVIDVVTERIRAEQRAIQRRKRRELFADLPGGVTMATLESIAACESGGDPTAVSSDGSYRGKYQFHPSTWEAVGGSGDPAAAPEAEQDYRAALLYAQSGSSPWPVCG
jgi:Transglycosylase-like domain